MSPDPSGASSASQFLESGDPEVLRLVAAGLAPLPLPELLEAQVELASGSDEALAATARESLAEVDPRIVVSVLTESPPESVVSYFGKARGHPVVVEAILRLRHVPRPLLAAMASGLEGDMQEILLLRQDAIVEHPEILDELEKNTRLSSYSERRIAEYREHLLPSLAARDDPMELDEEGFLPLTPEEETEVEHVRDRFAQIEEGKNDDELENLWKSSEVKIRMLTIAVRMRLARGATPLLRRILVRDQNPLVAVAVLTHSPITEGEVERVALSRVVVDDVLTHIATSKRWARRYKVIHSLCQNPRTPINISLRLLSRLSVRDLRGISRNRNVAEAVRVRATQLYRIKTE